MQTSKSLTVQGLKLNYHDVGQGAAVVLLHGWGSNLTSFQQLETVLSAHFRVLNLDLPGFGDSDMPKTPWAVADYVGLVKEFMTKLALEQPMLLGHSFGGRIGICLGAQGLVSKLILTNSAGVRPPRNLWYYLKIYTYKLAKKSAALFPPQLRTPLLQELHQRIGSEDYKNAHPRLRQILINVVNEDLSPLLAKITAPTLLIWGENDTTTPLAQAKVMEQFILDVGLVIIKEAGHFCFLDKPGEFNIIADYFFRH